MFPHFVKRRLVKLITDLLLGKGVTVSENRRLFILIVQMCILDINYNKEQA